MPSIALLTYYCALILAASIVGGMIPVWFQLTHRWMQFAVSFVAGVMLGVGVLHMLPHAILDLMAATPATQPDLAAVAPTTGAAEWNALSSAMVSLLAGMLAMFFIERFFSYHHHDVPDNRSLSITTPPPKHATQHPTSNHHHHSAHEHTHDLSWSGAALGLALHSVLNGVALAAAVQHGSDGSWLAGFGTFLVIFLHKPFDAMTIGMLMARGGWSLAWRHTVNALFSLAIPAGVMLFYFGLMPESADSAADNRRWFIACSLAFSAGTFLCISLSDLLPELQFHRHDRIKLSAALLLGLAVAYVAGCLEAVAHAAHSHPAPVGAASRAAPAIKEGETRRHGDMEIQVSTQVSLSPLLLVSMSLLPHGRLYQAYPTVAGRVSIQWPEDRIRKKMRGQYRFREENCMSGANHRTWQQYHVGHFLVTVELDPVADGRNRESHRDLAQVTRRLVDLMDAVRLPATWAVSDPAHSAATPLIVRSALPHELAILGDQNWIGPTAGRTRFARELARRVSQARAASLEVTTLVPRAATIERHMDLIVKQRITAIASHADPAKSSRQLTAPRALHYGVWELPATGTLPAPRSTWLSWSGWSTWRQIRRAARDAATYHLLIDAPSVAQNGSRTEKTIARLMRRVAALRDRGLVHVETLRTAAARLADVPTIAPQQSILHRAA